MDQIETRPAARQHDGIDYFGFLMMINMHLQPRSYLEIGTSTGLSLRHITCDALCIDPGFNLQGNPASTRKRTLLFQMGSDDFFADYRVRDYFPRGVDLAFLDGMHRFEYLLRDFINTERSSHRKSLILMHDCLPTNIQMALRQPYGGPDPDPETRNLWTGDVWRILPILKKYRPDLRVRVLDCPPTGLVAVSNLDPASDVLDRHYHAIVDEFIAISLEEYGLDAVWSEFPTIATKTLDTPAAMTAALSIW